MPPKPAKLVTIIAPYHARERVLDAIRDLGARGFSVGHVEGAGAHGHRDSGFTDTKNLVITVVASEALARKILTWVEEELTPVHAAIAYSADVLAVPGEHF
jgi:nitrogen regulatory protein P-II 2